ncbi:unnamed protein product [Cylicocyclus nassatus]|uniref:Uncharacterized protein n=1 Tax=Cylicocyclus nassatus TaxID=53992 RepID=A0AA36GY20_CYLNA|nr:unnamed protein product [Cylicocyclus nassatus]
MGLDSDNRAANCDHLKAAHAKLTSLLETCKRVMEEDRKCKNVSAREQLRHIGHFVRALDSSLYSSDINELFIYCDYFDEEFKSQVMETKVHLHEEIQQINQLIDELHENIMEERKRVGTLLREISELKASRRQHRTRTRNQVPVYACKEQPGPSGCSYWDIRLSCDIDNDGNSAFMILEE